MRVIGFHTGADNPHFYTLINCSGFASALQSSPITNGKSLLIAGGCTGETLFVPLKKYYSFQPGLPWL
jgi:hypothetical protein